MEKEQGKVISIRLVDILAIILIICAITVTVKNVKTKKNIQQIEDVAKSQQIEENNLRIKQSVSSRSEETSRQSLVQNEENTAESVVNSQNDGNNEIQSEENINDQTDDINKSENEPSEDTVVEENNYISLEELTISEKMDLTERTGLSKDDFVELISRVKQDSSKFFYENAELIYDLCEKYEINEIFFCGLISAESGWNIASNHRRTYNYISLMVNGTLKQFASVEDGLEQAAKVLHEKYLTPGGRFYNGKTLAGVKTRFCPSSSTWTGLVYGRMKQIYNNK